MSQSIRTVIVIGGAGNCGRQIVSALLASGHFRVSALTRASSTSTFPPAVTAIKTNYTSNSLIQAFKGQDAVVSAIATSNLTDQKLIIDAAAEAGVKRFIPSEFGWDTSVKVGLEIAPCTAMKVDTVNYLRERESSGMTWTSIVNGLWLEWATAQSEWPWWSIRNKTFTQFDGGDVPFEMSSLAQVARTVTAVLQQGNLEATKNTYVYVHSCTLTQNQLLEIFEEFTGQKWRVSPNKVKDVNTAGQEIWFRLTKDKSLEELGNVPEFQLAIVLMITSGCFGLAGVNMFREKAKHWMEKLGLEEEDPALIIREALWEYAAKV